jgi:hypothetical protein
MSDKPTVVVWLWSDKGKPSYTNWKHSKYSVKHVNAVYRMVRRFYKTPHRFLCITDEPNNPAFECETLSIFKALEAARPGASDLLHMGAIIPGTWARLCVWAPGMSALLGPRLISLDLDCVAVDDLAPLFDNPAPFLGWYSRGGPHVPLVYNASFFALDTESRPDIWTDFNPETAEGELALAGYSPAHGTEQAWQSCKLGLNQKAWTWRNGMASYKFQCPGLRLPSGARLVFFHGQYKPWTQLNVPWISKYYPAKDVGL